MLGRLLFLLLPAGDWCDVVDVEPVEKHRRPLVNTLFTKSSLHRRLLFCRGFELIYVLF
jgi:hypothetical protein